MVSLGTFFFSSRRRHTRFSRDWSSDVCSSDLEYGVDRKTFYLMLKRMNVSIPPGLILPRFQELIYFHLDKPKKSFFATVGLPLRSEERRVGKERRSGRRT